MSLALDHPLRHADRTSFSMANMSFPHHKRKPFLLSLPVEVKEERLTIGFPPSTVSVTTSAVSVTRCGPGTSISETS